MAAAAALFLACTAIAAQAPTPPLKPGLWLLRMQPDDPAVAARLRELQARLKDAPPQLRQLAESMLQQQGAAWAGGDSVRLCLSAADLASGAWQGAPRGGACTTTVTPGAGGARFHTRCSAPVPSDTEGEARFLDAEHYTLSTTTTVTTGSGTRTVRASGQASWLSAGCGELGR